MVLKSEKQKKKKKKKKKVLICNFSFFLFQFSTFDFPKFFSMFPFFLSSLFPIGQLKFPGQSVRRHSAPRLLRQCYSPERKWFLLCETCWSVLYFSRQLSMWHAKLSTPTLRAKMRKKICKVWGKIRKNDRNLREKWGKWNFCPPGTVRLATAVLVQCCC